MGGGLGRKREILDLMVHPQHTYSSWAGLGWSRKSVTVTWEWQWPKHGTHYLLPGWLH